MDITKAQFPNLANVAGMETFSYAQLLAQLQIDIGGVSPNIGIGCKATASNVTIASGGRKVVPYDAVVFDDANFLDIGGANPERMTIPLLDPVIKRIVIGGFQSWGATVPTVGTVRSIIFTIGPNEISFGSKQQIPLTIVPGDANITLAMSPPIDVVAGDFFQTQAFTTGGAGGNVNLAQAAGWIIVLR